VYFVLWQLRLDFRKGIHFAEEITMKTVATTLYPFVPSGPDVARSIEFFGALGFEKQWHVGFRCHCRTGLGHAPIPAHVRKSGVMGAFSLGLVLPESQTAVAGASLAISGVLGAYAAYRWASRPRSIEQRALVVATESVSILTLAAWLTLRETPTRADLTCSIVYHAIPFLAMWLVVRAVNRFAQQRSKSGSAT
jgi:hypothetical protein